MKRGWTDENALGVLSPQDVNAGKRRRSVIGRRSGVMMGKRGALADCGDLAPSCLPAKRTPQPVKPTALDPFVAAEISRLQESAAREAKRADDAVAQGRTLAKENAVLKRAVCIQAAQAKQSKAELEALRVHVAKLEYELRMHNTVAHAHGGATPSVW